MRLVAGRFTLRDFVEADREAFVAYQVDPRYRTLHDARDDDGAAAHRLFDRFLEWAARTPRLDFQLGVFDGAGQRLYGCVGLRMSEGPAGTAVFGIELAPDHWGRYRLAINAATALIEFGFGTLQLERIVGTTASGNRSVARLASWFGAELTARRPGPAWMSRRGWEEVDWSLSRAAWFSRDRRTASWSPSPS